MTIYQHETSAGEFIDLPIGKTVCVGRNYAAHIEELNNATPTEPLLFIKPDTALCHARGALEVPLGQGPCHNELELAVLIRSRLQKAAPEQVLAAVWGYGLGLDLTLRDVQTALKDKGLPWERAKAFDGSCALSGFVAAEKVSDPQSLSFKLWVNDTLRQHGECRFMLWTVATLLSEISQVFTLRPGDVVLTGTPKGVGPLESGDELRASLLEHFELNAEITTRTACDNR